MRRRITEVTQSKTELNEKIKQQDIERLDGVTERENLVTKSHNLDMSLTKIDSDLEYLRQRIDEEYGLNYEGCLEYKEDDYDPSTAASQIANCKRQITMLGAINHNAVEEFD